MTQHSKKNKLKERLNDRWMKFMLKPKTLISTDMNVTNLY